jgi:hypothetical protein
MRIVVPWRMIVVRIVVPWKIIVVRIVVPWRMIVVRIVVPRRMIVVRIVVLWRVTRMIAVRIVVQCRMIVVRIMMASWIILKRGASWSGSWGRRNVRCSPPQVSGGRHTRHLQCFLRISESADGQQHEVYAAHHCRESTVTSWTCATEADEMKS